MKIRTGFVSNSSSSSFIITAADLYALNKDIESVKHYVKKFMQEYREQRLSKTFEEYRHDYLRVFNSSEIVEEEIVKAYNDNIEKIKQYYSDENIKNNIVIMPYKQFDKEYDEDVDLPYYYPNRFLCDDTVVIYTLIDNFIPEEVADKIVEQFRIEPELYYTHM